MAAGRMRSGWVVGMLLVPVVGGFFAAARDVRAALPARTFKLPAVPDRYSDPVWPAHFDDRTVKTLDNTPADNPTTDAGAALGRVLFYDTRLSANNTISCGTCHQQEHAFAEPREVSVGFRGVRVDRNSSGLANLRFTRAGFFWDERAATLEEAIVSPLHSQLELGHNAQSLVKGLSKERRYQELFRTAFGSPEITEPRVIKALSQFIRAMVSYRSRYDVGATKAASFRDPFPGFTAQENEGKRLFIERCNLCHHIGEGNGVAVFGMFSALLDGSTDPRTSRDAGLADITLNPGDFGRFKAPDLRNIAATAPYGHDGHFPTLEAVVEHYATVPGVEPASRFQYTPENKAALVAFLKTLTDEELLKDPRFSDPWVGPARKPQAMAKVPVLAAPAVTPLSPRTLAERVADGTGLRAGEVLPWLKGLDANHNGVLEPDEYEEVARVLARSGVQRIAPGRGAVRDELSRGGQPVPTPLTLSDGTLLGDFDRDGKVSETEQGQITALKRAFELGDGGRLETTMDRLLTRFPLATPQIVAMRAAIRDRKAKLKADRMAADRRLEAQLREALGAERFKQYQTLAVAGGPRGARPRELDVLLPRTRPLVTAFDVNMDRRLDAAETQTMAKALDQLSGGFGGVPQAGMTLAEFEARLMRWYDPKQTGRIDAKVLPERMGRLRAGADANRDGSITPAELHEFLRPTAFAYRRDEGIYIGGGFANFFLETSYVLDQLQLPEGARSKAESLLTAHQAHLDGLTRAAVAEGFQAVRAAATGRK